MKRRPSRQLASLTVSTVLERLPLPVLKRLGLQRCIGCAIAPFDTLADAARVLGLDQARLERAVGAALAKAETR